MFEKLKKYFVKVIGGAFVVLLVLSFAVWGIGDVFRGGTGGNTLVTVGDLDIDLPEAESLLDQELRGLRQRSGRYIERDQAIAMGLGQRVLAELIADRSVEAHARALGLVVDDASLARIVAANPTFQVGGRFDKARFEQLIRSNGLTEEGYLQLVRRDELRRMMILSIGVAAAAPETAADLLWAYRNEERQGRVLRVNAEMVDGVADPTDEQLEALLKDQQESYRAPEYRSFTLLTMTPEDLAPEIQISEERLREVYEERAAEFTSPATRTVQQLTGPDEAALSQARTRVQAGEPAEAVAQSMEGVELLDLGTISRGNFPDRAVEDAIFAGPVGGVSEITRTAFGNQVMFVIQDETPESRTPFEEVRQQIRDELALVQAADDLPNLENAVQDQIAGGASLEEAARSGGFEVRKVEMTDQAGNDPQGESIDPALPDPVLQTAFSAAQGDISVMEPLPEGGDYLLRVDAIEPERDRRLDEVRDELRDAWLADARMARAKEIATELHTAVTGGQTLEQAAEGHPAAQVLSIGPVKRDDLGETDNLGPQTVERLFATPPDQPPGEPVELPTGYGLVVTDQVTPAPEEGADTLTTALAGEMTSDVVDQYDQALRQRFPPVVHERALENFMRTTNQAQ
ncbi:peptidylprolyl isomerase [Geminicoccus roseus]|uniref:peptidylprolyl isomerase n=1 Tax=Geminicoccus roseus TaxID=404900 RepID=UPI00040FBF03|nr:peptidylprolyl isomerase [Geminicoccus roseus]